MKKSHFTTLALALGFIACTACGQDKKNAPAAAREESKPAAAESGKAEAAAPSAALLTPASLKEQAPATFKVRMDTSKGSFVIECNRDWAPQGVDRFYNLVKAGFFTDIAFFRAIDGFMCQFGIHGDPKIATAWKEASIQDDAPGKASNTPGMVTFAMRGPNTRTTQMFINFGNNQNLDSMGFPPIGKVSEGMSVVNSLNTEYGEGAPRGRGPDQGRIQAEGNAYLKKDFPRLDYIKSATLLK